MTLEAHPDFLPMVQQAIREENDRIARGDFTEEERAMFQAAKALGDHARQKIEQITTDIFLQRSKP